MASEFPAPSAHAKCNAPLGLKLKNMDEKNMHNLFLKNMSGLIEEARNPSPGENPWEIWSIAKVPHKRISISHSVMDKFVIFIETLLKHTFALKVTLKVSKASLPRLIRLVSTLVWYLTM